MDTLTFPVSEAKPGLIAGRCESDSPMSCTQAQTSYHKGMAVFVHTKGGLMCEAAIGGQKFSFKAK